SSRRSGNGPLLWKSKKSMGIPMADVPDHFPDPLHIIGQESPFDVLPQEIAEDPSIIFMPGKGQEAPAVGDHAHRGAEQPHGGEMVQLISYPVHLVQEPPGRPELYLALDALPGEISRHGCEYRIVRRV